LCRNGTTHEQEYKKGKPHRGQVSSVQLQNLGHEKLRS
jgi:hypothetical protein